MIKEPLVSVIIPIYNILEYLPRCVESVCKQGYRNLEIILVDDGSNDGTEKLCDQLAQKDSRIKVIHKENGGSSSARNCGLKEATGEYVGFVDSDDYIEPTMYELLVKAILEKECKIAQVGRDEIDASGNKLPNICEPPTQEQWISARDFLEELLLHKGDASFCTKLLKRELFEEKGFPEGELNEDFRLLVSLLLEVDGIISIPKQSYHVFYRIGSNTRKKEKDSFSRVYFDCVKNADRVEEIVKERYLDLVPVAFRFGVFQRIEYLLHIPISMMVKENTEYMEVCAGARKRWGKAWKNPILTTKNKVYLTLFAIAPKQVRKIHKRIKGL